MVAAAGRQLLAHSHTSHESSQQESMPTPAGSPHLMHCIQYKHGSTREVNYRRPAALSAVSLAAGAEKLPAGGSSQL